MKVTEQIVTLPVLNPATRGKSRTFIFMGKVDLIEDQRIADWKVVGDPSRFINGLTIGFQAELYALSVKEQFGLEISELEYRIIKRPRIKYTEPTFTYAVMKAGRKTALKVCQTYDEASKLAEMQGGTVDERCKGDPDRDRYEERCLNWILAQDDGLVTHRYILAASKLRRAAEYLWDSSKKIIENRANQRWIPNPKACHIYERECQYMPLCESLINGGDCSWLEDSDYRTLAFPHPELGDTADHNTLTHSSISDLNSCEMFYFWRYERGLRKKTDETSEALRVGSATHVGMDALVRGDIESAFRAINDWSLDHLALGQDAFRRQEQDIARARACVRAASMKWLNHERPRNHPRRMGKNV